MRRMLTLILFELKKILNRKKAILFLLALNIIPLVASAIALIVYLKFRGWGLGEFQFSMLYEGVQGLFIGHVKLFAWIAPFFLALVVGDSFSNEISRGYMKMLLITPVRRWQVITAKTAAVMLFLLIAVSLGGLFLQLDLMIARTLTSSNSILMDALEAKSTYLISTSAAFQILIMTFLGNLMLIGFFIVFSLFFESAIIMSFSSLSVLMGIQTYYFIISSGALNFLDKWYQDIASWCFTRHLSELFKIKQIELILEGKANILSPEVSGVLLPILGWTAVFYILAIFIFSRKQILH
jgi:ABC-type transport system involved in multi-copper enzyme maturation permease subunit